MSIISITSGKGGVGKTVISANLGLALGDRNKKILLVDADLPSGNLAHYMGVNNPYPSFTEYLSGDEESIEEVLKEVNDQVHILPAAGSLRNFLSADAEKIKSAMDEVDEDYDHILIDTPPGISKNSLAPIEASEQMILVLTPDEGSVSSGEKVQKVGNLLDKRIKGFILNKKKNKGFFGKLLGGDTQMSLERILARMATDNIGTVPYDEKVRESTEVGKALLEYDEGSKASEAIKKISLKI